MKTRFALLLLASFMLLSLLGKSQVTFQKTFGGTSNDEGISVQQTYDGGYIIAGYTGSFGAGGDDMYLIKTDGGGDTLWVKTFGGTGADQAWSVRQTTDGGYIILGETNSFGAGGVDFYLIRTDSIGNTLWSKTYGGIDDALIHAVQQTTDGGFVLTGQSRSFGANRPAYLIKTDSIGNSLWTKTYGGLPNYEGGWSVQQTADNGYLIGGWTKSFGAGSWDFYMIRTDSIGNILFTKTFGGAGDDRGYTARQTTDGGYIMVGRANSFGAGSWDVFLVRTDSIGDTLWTKTYGGAAQDVGIDVRQTADGGFIVVGSTLSFGFGFSDIYAIRTDVNGDTLWTRTFGGTGDDFGFEVEQTLDGGYIIGGRTNSFGAGSYDVYLIKIDSIGNSGCNQISTGTIVNNQLTLTGSGAIVNSGVVVTTPVTIVNNTATIDSVLCICNVLADAGPDSSVCSGDSIVMTASGGIVYLWSTGATTASITVGPASSTTYYVTVTDGACANMDSVTITIIPSPAPTNLNTSICDDDSLYAGGSYQTTTGTYYDTLVSAQSCDSVVITNLTILNSTSTTNNLSICLGDSVLVGGGYQTSTGTYFDNLVGANGCDSNIITNVSILPGTGASAETDTTIQKGENVQLFGYGGPGYSWSPTTGLSCTDCPNPIASPLVTTTYYLTVIDSFGCSSLDSVVLTVLDAPCTEPYVPNVFSPNSDGTNDVLYVRGKGLALESFFIYDRWGRKTFETTDPLSGWDGIYESKEAEMGVYVFYLKFICSDGQVYERKGNITLVR